MAQPFKPETLVLGVGLIVLGVLWTLANMGSLDLLGTLRRWWPATLVLWGLLELYRSYADARTGRSK
jgi:cell wall-active antibiotic response 4TMS protein YvqF